MRVKVDTRNLERRFSRENMMSAKEATTERIALDARKYVPVDSGALRDSEGVNSNYPDGEVIWATPYAQRIYNADSVRHTINPQAAPHWCEVAKQHHTDEWRKLYLGMLEK